jgi:hypothetical protein
MSPRRYRNDINKTKHFEKNVEMSEENYDVLVPCTYLLIQI